MLYCCLHVIVNSCRDIYYGVECGYVGSSLEVKTETDSNDAMEIKTEADSNDITECTHHNQSYAALSGVSDAVFSTFICLCITVTYVDEL